MFFNYMKVACRTLWRYKMFSSINILGLTLGMTICLLILLMIRDQSRYDTFHRASDRIYRVISDVEEEDGTTSYAVSPAPLAETLMAEAPSVADVARLRRDFEGLGDLRSESGNIDLSGFYADPGFFRIFNFPLMADDAGSALEAPFSLVLSYETALQFFPDEDPLGKVVSIQGEEFVITGVMDKPLGKTNLRIDVLASYATLGVRDATRPELADWSVGLHYTYILLDEEAAPEALEAQLTQIAESRYPPAQSGSARFRVQAITDVQMGESLREQIGILSHPICRLLERTGDSYFNDFRF